MTVRLKTIEYAFPTSEISLASATRRDFAALTIYIPEITSRYFRSVHVEVSCRDTVTTATSLTAMLIGMKLAAAAFEDQAITATIVNSGEQQSYMFISGAFTDYWNTNFGSGTSQTCQVGVRFTGPSVINIAVKLVITYEYDDASAGDTRIKTVRIPLESLLSTLGTSLTEWGTSQIPNLDTFLPEASKVYRDIFFELWMNEATNTTTDSSLGLALDSESSDADGLHENGLTSACWYHYIWKRTDMTTNATHAFKATAPAAMPCNHAACVLVVTYEYNHTNSTSIMNSLMMPVMLGQSYEAWFDGFAGGEFNFLITESNISLQQSGVIVHYMIDSGCTISVQFGAQSYRDYIDPSVLYCGGSVFGQRIDSGSAGGVGISIARGENALSWVMYSSSNTVLPTAIGGVFILNYTSDKASSGADSHNHTVIQEAVGIMALTVNRDGGTYGLDGLATWYLNTAGAIGYNIDSRNTNKPDTNFVLDVDMGADGYVPMATMVGRSDIEVGPVIFAFDLDMSKVKRHYSPGWTDARKLDITANSRGWWLPQSNLVAGVMLCWTITQIEWTISGTVANYTGDGSALTVELFRADSGDKVLQATTATGGTFTKKWFENTVNLFAVCRQSSSLVGRSDDGVAS